MPPSARGLPPAHQPMPTPYENPPPIEKVAKPTAGIHDFVSESGNMRFSATLTRLARLRGRERCRAAVPRSGHALGGRRPGDRRDGCIGQPDGPLRQRVADPAKEPRRPCRFDWPVDRHRAQAAPAEDRRTRHGFEREPDLWRAGGERLQRSLQLHVLSPAVRIQPARDPAIWSGARYGQATCIGRRLARHIGTSRVAYRGKGTRLYFRGDAAFANPEIYEFLEVEGMGYAIRFPANRVLQEKIGYLLKRPAGRPPHEVRRYHASFSYQAQSWKKPIKSHKRGLAE